MGILRQQVIRLAVLTATLTSARTADAQPAVRRREFSHDSAAIVATIAQESVAFWNKDYNAWASFWVHEPYVRVMGWWARGGVTVREGWDVVSGEVAGLMKESPKPNPTASQLRRDNVNLQIRGDVAWVTFDQRGSDTGDLDMDMAGLSRETRVLEKRGGKWRIAYSGWLLQGAGKD